MKETKETIRKYIVENFLFGEDEGLKDDTSLLEKKIIDSTGILELVAFLEKEFSIRIRDDELVPENLDSIDNMHHYLSGKKTPSADCCSAGAWVSI
ncbi:acyl carrier protein [Geotalea toluenoxydans]|uniref:acyl carrier protein n=1 Tax=Geotalea toluenoxydans TaxID=421624 RepID=UPI0006D1469B|nr:acyl carrier protein [Geotalea toluenoxydans]